VRLVRGAAANEWLDLRLSPGIAGSLKNSLFTLGKQYR
jgi:hypothetical protein